MVGFYFDRFTHHPNKRRHSLSHTSLRCDGPMRFWWLNTRCDHMMMVTILHVDERTMLHQWTRVVNAMVTVDRYLRMCPDRQFHYWQLPDGIVVAVSSHRHHRALRVFETLHTGVHRASGRLKRAPAIGDLRMRQFHFRIFEVHINHFGRTILRF